MWAKRDAGGSSSSCLSCSFRLIEWFDALSLLRTGHMCPFFGCLQYMYPHLYGVCLRISEQLFTFIETLHDVADVTRCKGTCCQYGLVGWLGELHSYPYLPCDLPPSVMTNFSSPQMGQGGFGFIFFRNVRTLSKKIMESFDMSDSLELSSITSLDTETFFSEHADASINTHHALTLEDLRMPKDEKQRARNGTSAAESRKRARAKVTALQNENEQLKLENDYLKKLLYEKQESNGESTIWRDRTCRLRRWYNTSYKSVRWSALYLTNLEQIQETTRKKALSTCPFQNNVHEIKFGLV